MMGLGFGLEMAGKAIPAAVVAATTFRYFDIDVTGNAEAGSPNVTVNLVEFEAAASAGGANLFGSATATVTNGNNPSLIVDGSIFTGASQGHLYLTTPTPITWAVDLGAGNEIAVPYEFRITAPAGVGAVGGPGDFAIYGHNGGARTLLKTVTGETYTTAGETHTFVV